jgi:hypothetical protein
MGKFKEFTFAIKCFIITREKAGYSYRIANKIKLRWFNQVVGVKSNTFFTVLRVQSL